MLEALSDVPRGPNARDLSEDAEVLCQWTSQLRIQNSRATPLDCDLFLSWSRPLEPFSFKRFKIRSLSRRNDLSQSVPSDRGRTSRQLTPQPPVGVYYKHFLVWSYSGEVEVLHQTEIMSLVGTVEEALRLLALLGGEKGVGKMMKIRTWIPSKIVGSVLHRRSGKQAPMEGPKSSRTIGLRGKRVQFGVGMQNPS
jgi:hypothetical protein